MVRLYDTFCFFLFEQKLLFSYHKGRPSQEVVKQYQCILIMDKNFLFFGFHLQLFEKVAVLVNCDDFAFF
jgi:hypothetical protein